MDESNKSESSDPMADFLSQGRTVDEQIEWVKKYGNHGSPQTQRMLVLNANGVYLLKDKAENVIAFGCYMPFASPHLLRNIIKLLDLIGVDYTTLEQEVCCGAPFFHQTSKDKRENILQDCREMIESNVSMASRKGADTLAYCCVGCVHTTKALFPGNSNHLYIYDLIAEKLGDRPLKVPETVVGYFEGCHTDYKVNYPGITIGWERYRQLLDKIEGLKVVDLPNNLCCKKAPDKIVENAKKLNLDSILCGCNGCYGFLRGFIGDTTKAGICAMSLPEILIQSLGQA